MDKKTINNNNNNNKQIAYDTYNKSRGHIRSASLENANSFILKNTLGLPQNVTGHTGTLKSRNEQKRLKNRFGSHNNLDDYVAQSKTKFQNLRNMFETKNELEQNQIQLQQQLPQIPEPQQQTQQQQQMQLIQNQQINLTITKPPLQPNPNNYQNQNVINNNINHNNIKYNTYNSNSNNNNNTNTSNNNTKTPTNNFNQLNNLQQSQLIPQTQNYRHQHTHQHQISNVQQQQQQQQHQRTPSKLMNGLEMNNHHPPLIMSPQGYNHNHHNHHHHAYRQPQQMHLIEFNENLSIVEDHIAGLSINSANPPSIPQQQQLIENNCSETGHDQAKNLLRPIAFKPIPFEPDYSIPNRYSDLCDRYGSTPSLAPIQGPNMKFGSTTDLRHTSYNSYCSNLMARRRCSRSLKTNDSMESVRHTPDSDANSQNSTIKSNNKFHHHHQVDQFDMTPSPSDSGISELEAALKDRDSELSYLRQTMEHNEKVIFKVHKDKEVYWEQETKRLKAFYENQQKEYLLKIKKMEQMLTLQSFQFKQNKLRITENSNRIRDQFTDIKNENDILRNETEGLKSTERTMRDRILQLEEKINVMDNLILNLKTQLEENEWTVCQKNGEIALLKTQLKEAKMDLTLKGNEIVNLKNENHNEIHNHTEIICNSNNTELKNNNNMKLTQLNHIIILKDQVILALTNELGKLRKELSDLAIFHEYGKEPAGKFSRLKYKIENLSGIYNQNEIIDSECRDNFDDNSRTTEKFVRKALEEDDLDVIINCLKSTGALTDLTFKNNDSIILNALPANIGSLNEDNEQTSNLPDVTRNFFDSKQNQEHIQNVTTHHQTINETEVLKRELNEARTAFETEKQEWAAEKEKVLAYQRQLQMHYISMYQKMKELEHQVSQKC